MHRLFAQAYFYSEIQDISDSFVAQPFSEHFDRFTLRCFDIVFQRPYFSIALKVDFSLSDRIEICENIVSNKIDITMTTINKKL